MSKLWEKGYTLDPLIETFTVGEDYLLDSKLVFYDCLGSIAHARMLYSIGLLSEEETKALVKALAELSRSGVPITLSDEDVHTAVENALGALGKRLHAGRSRNDQVLVTLRLFGKDQLLKVGKALAECVATLLAFAMSHEFTAIPGRTHMQRAMPSSLGLWGGAYAESLLDDFEMLQGAYGLLNQCPLGSGSSYGVSLSLDRSLTAELLGFARVQNNALYCNNSRGKMEAVCVHALSQIMTDLSKLSADLIFFSLPEIGYLRLPETLCSGSSLMPQKRNPCGLELIRARTAIVSGSLVQLLEITRGLPSGYHRDFQETKGPFMRAFDVACGSLAVAKETVAQVIVEKEVCEASFTPEVFATDLALQLVKQGVPFREAYRQVASHPESYVNECPVANLQRKTHIGAPGNLGLEENERRLAQWRAWVERERTHYDARIQALLEVTHV